MNPTRTRLLADTHGYLYDIYDMFDYALDGEEFPYTYYFPVHGDIRDAAVGDAFFLVDEKGVFARGRLIAQGAVQDYEPADAGFDPEQPYCFGHRVYGPITIELHSVAIWVESIVRESLALESGLSADAVQSGMLLEAEAAADLHRAWEAHLEHLRESAPADEYPRVFQR